MDDKSKVVDKRIVDTTLESRIDIFMNIQLFRINCLLLMF